ncbi:MAG: HAD hydrolase-like protein [Clostridia bacterium]|nr:HAD hydrolase-like protein [Clostridia bacterium]
MENMVNIKYLILDMGYVLVKPTSGDWLVTPVLLKNVDINEIDIKKASKIMSELGHTLDGKVETLDEEKEMMMKFYTEVFKRLEYDITKEKVTEIVDDFVYNLSDTKYTMYNDVKEQLERLSKKYTLLMLSDNWPCAYRYLEKHGIDKYFDKVYISSVYGELKRDKVLFNHPINDYNIKAGEACFVDDKETLLDIAVEKNLEVMLMDRGNKIHNSKYKTIKCLGDID